MPRSHNSILRKKSRHSSARNLLLQHLERREVFSVDASFSGGVLTVQADDLPNEIVAWADLAANKLNVKLDATVFQVPNDLVQHIKILAKGGDDTVVIMPSVGQTTQLEGGGGDDRISGSQQRDLISGDSGNDRIAGNAGNDRIEGGVGNDRIDGGDGDDYLQGGIGDDLLVGGGGNDEVYGDGASEEVGPSDEETMPMGDATARGAAASAVAPDVMLVSAPVATVALSFNDIIYGSDGNDIVRAGLGHDIVFGGDGNDAIAGGAGVDFVEGGRGNDRIDGGNGVDVIFGGEGNDSIGGGAGGDYLIGGAGNDLIEAGTGNDWVFGDATNSYPAGYANPVQYAIDFAALNRGLDSILAGDGNDIVAAGNGNDRVDGGDGADLLVGGEGNDGLNGGEGSDLILGDWRLVSDDADADGIALAETLVGTARAIVEVTAAELPVELNATFNDVIEGGGGRDLIF